MPFVRRNEISWNERYRRCLYFFLRDELDRLFIAEGLIESYKTFKEKKEEYKLPKVMRDVIEKEEVTLPKKKEVEEVKVEEKKFSIPIDFEKEFTLSLVAGAVLTQVN